jgi:hypothetical protein
MSVCPSDSTFVRPYGTTRLTLDGFSWNLIFGFFLNLSWKFKFHQNLLRTEVLYIKTNIQSYLLQFFSEWEIFQKSCRESRNTHFMFSNIFKPCRYWDKVEKYYRAGHVTGDNMAHAHCMLDTKGCKHTLRICNTHCFSTSTIVARTRLIVTEKFNDFFLKLQ